MTTRPPIRRLFWYPSAMIATWFGAGLMPKAPGTFGSLMGLLWGGLILLIGGFWALLAAILLLFFPAWIATSYYVLQEQADDPGAVVVDEVLGQWIAMLGMALPILPFATNPWLMLVAFLLFRIFDIAKPWPISVIDQKMKSPLGVLLDDVLAGAIVLILTGPFYIVLHHFEIL